MIIRTKAPRQLALDEPIRHESAHKRPRTRRDFIAQGLVAGPAVVSGIGLLSYFANPRRAFAALSPDMQTLAGQGVCNLVSQGAGRIPFIAFDLAGGANLAGSEALIGGQGGALDFLSTAGYAKLGLPGDMLPQSPNAASPTNNFINNSFGLPWHSDGAMLRGMLEKASAATQALTNGAVIAARSENDTGNNPHNPMYGLYKCDAKGSLLNLIGSRTSDSGGNSMAPAAMIDLAARPTKVDRASDVTGLVDTGQLGQLFTDPADTLAVLESIARISGGNDPAAGTGNVPYGGKLGALDMTTRDAAIKKAVRCGYVKSADLVDRFGNPSALNPDLDPNIVGPGGIFSQAEYQADDEFRKTAAIMKMVVNGYAGAGTVTMGGYDYHGQGRATGEVRNLRAGRCIGACLEYARRVGVPLMVYVFSDGSLNANGAIDNTPDGRGKFMWASDNQSTAASLMLVFNPGRRPTLLDGAGGYPAARHQQIGYFTADGSVATTSHPGANAVNLLVEIVILNWLALHGEQGQLANFLGSTGLPMNQIDQWTAFSPICNGRITQPV